MKCAAILLAAVGAAYIANAQARAPQIGNGTKHARASIEAVSASATRAQLLVTLALDPGWHVSWRNPGETGLPTRLTWSLPVGVRAVNETWPVPVIAHTSVGATHTLEGDVPWLVDFAIDSASDAERLLSLTIRYGVCRDVCIPEQQTVQGVLPGKRSRAPAAVALPLRTRLSTNAGAIAARRVAKTELCFARVPLVSGAALPEVIADSGLGLDAALPLTQQARGSHHVFVMNISAASPLHSGSQLLFVRGSSGVAAQLDFKRPAPGCTAP